MSTKTVIINGQDVKFDELVAFILSLKKIQAIKFIKTKFNLDLRDAKSAVEEIQGGNPERAFLILNPHNECSDPILDNNVDYSTAGQRNPFLIEESKVSSRAKLILIVGLAILLLGLAMAYFSMQDVAG